MSARVALRSTTMLAACLMLPGAAAAQSEPALLVSHGRVTVLLSYMTVHVGELLLACAAKQVLTEEQAEARFSAYRERNALLLERAEAWSREAEQRLRAQGQEHAMRRQAEDAALNAAAEASTRAQGEIGRAGDVRATCAARFAAIESGGYDLSGNTEFVNLPRANP